MDFTFVGSTICYAFMQAVGMVNDHAERVSAENPSSLWQQRGAFDHPAEFFLGRFLNLPGA